MHSHPGPSQQGAYNTSNLKPEAGLAEWTSKIKAMQRQVDADEEAEQKRLEEEIAASRLARLRRNQGVGFSGRLNSVGISKLNDHTSTGIESGGGTSGITKVVIERRNNQEDVPIGSLVGRSSVGAAAPSVSLASFIGGRAAGPRLNRPTFQQDGHDASQLQWPGYGQAPQPVFGRGGVAMPGIAHFDTKVTDSDRGGSETKKQNWPRLLHSPQAVNAISPETVTSQPQDHTPQTPDLPERAIITSSLQPSTRSIEKPLVYRHSDKQSTTIPLDANQDNNTPSHKPRVPHVLSPKAVTQIETSRRSFDGSSANSPKSSVTMNALARPISPRTRVSSRLPQTPPSQIPSPAFLRHPLQKDPTPSISRLQGRGFVQSMVKVSTQLETSPAPSERTSEKGLTSGGRRVSVLDRWQQCDSPQTPPSSTSPTTRPIRRSATADPNPASPQQRQLSLQTSSTKTIKSATSSPSLRSVRADVAIPIQSYNKQDGLGSATTLLVYKPKLTASPSSSMDVDELGFHKKEAGAIAAKSGRELPAPSGSPLSHLTKGRARKPRKSKRPGSEPPIVTSGSTHPPEIRTNVRSALTLPQSSASTLSQQSKSVIAATSNIVFNSPKIASSVLPQDEELLSNVHTTRCLPDTAESQPISSPRPDDALALTNADPPIATLEGMKRGDASFSQQSPKHSRIPSTGKRATVMDVAQALHDESSRQMIGATDVINGIGLNSDPLQPMNLNRPRNGEKRKSSYEKYSSIILPPLQEETSPLPSPAGTLTHAPTSVQRQTFADPLSHLSLSSLTLDKHMHLDDFTTLQTASIEIILKSYQPLVISNPLSQSISVEVMIVTGNTATSISQEQSVFYDMELLAIIHRSKSLDSGLVSTVMWVWQGKRCTLAEREERKLHELARHYGTMAHIVRQNSEPPDLVQVLGGRLAIRQGTRAHWTPENTAMHLIRSKGGVIFIDEHDLNIQYLCSAFSYCLSILDTLYVWHGRGSTFQERKAALEYARSLEKGGLPAVELSEDGNDDDEMFWLILGNGEFAKAHYWRWRKSSPMVDPHIWRVDATLGNAPMLPVNSFSEERETHSSVYIIDCVWELYILVGRDARSQIHDITLASKVTSELSIRVAPDRPYTPTIHVLLLPTQLPRDLRVNLRGLNEQFLENNLDMPDHMNILSLGDASNYVQSTFWDQSTRPSIVAL